MLFEIFAQLKWGKAKWLSIKSKRNLKQVFFICVYFIFICFYFICGDKTERSKYLMAEKNISVAL